MDKVPFFIVGCPRSGTTLLQLLLDSHPNIAIPPESHIFFRFSKIFNYYGNLQDEENLKLIVKDLLRDYHIRDWELGVSVSEFCSFLKEKSLKSVIALIFELYAMKEGKQRWGDKTPQHALHLNEIQNMFPEAKFIHLVRDGRDVAVSSSKIFVGPPSIYGIANEWKRYIQTFNEFKVSLDSSKYLEVIYENLVRNSKEETKKIFEFLNERPIAIGSGVPETSSKKYYLRTDAHMNSLKLPITTKKIGIYKNTFSERDIEIFEFVAREELSLYGYNLISKKPVQISRREKINFLLKDKFYRYYRKYFRPKELDKAWILARREFQRYIRNFLRSKRHKIKFS